MKEYKNGISLDDFFSAYFECRKNKRRTENQLEFELNYEENLVDLWEEVNEGRYRIGQSICFCVTRPKIREVFAANFRDRVVHHVLIRKLNPLFEEEFIDDNYNCRKGKGVLYGVTRLRDKMISITENYSRDAWIGKFDLQGFFMSIDKGVLLERLNKFVKEKYMGSDIDLVLHLIKLIVTNCPQDNCIRKGDLGLWNSLPRNKSLFTCGRDKGLPIGNLTSQIFGNFYLSEFDRWLSNEFSGYYGRYVDDFYIISGDKERILEFIPRMRDYLGESLKVKLHKDKIYIQPCYHGISFIGSMIKKGRIYTGNRTIDNMIDTIIGYNYKVSGEDAFSFCQSLNSYLGFLKHSNSYGIKRNLCGIINPEWWNYLEILGDYKKVGIKRRERL